ncbi:molybdate ABC transporter substrate-binding protein [Arthrobacter sp. TMN-50]
MRTRPIGTSTLPSHRSRALLTRSLLTRSFLTIGSCGALVALGACTPANDSMADDQTLTVFAAASLQSTFTELADDFEVAHPGATVTLSFAGSSELATQLSAGASADVFASADTATMERLVQEGLINGDPVPFATNTLIIAVPPGNPAGVEQFSDLADAGTSVVLCAPQVPCGAAATQAQEAASITVNAVSEESSVTDVLGKVRSGEADAGLVYVTDVLAADGEVEGVPFDEAAGVVNLYPAGAVANGNPDLAAAFLDFLTGPEGQEVLTNAGFGSP